MNEATIRKLVTLMLLVLAGASILAVVATGRTPSTDESRRRAQRLVPAYHKEAITGLWVRRGAQRYELRRNPANAEGWRLVAPLAAEADELVVEKLLKSLESATFRRKLEPHTIDRRRLELVSPRFELAVAVGGQRTTLKLGAPVPGSDGAAYVEVSVDGSAESDVYVVNKQVIDNWTLELSALRRVQFLPYGSVEVRQIRYRSGPTELTLERDERGLWFVAEGHRRTLAQRTSVQRLFETLADMDNATPTLLDAASKPTQADQSLLTIDLLPLAARAPKARLSFGGTCPSDPNLLVALRSEPDALAVCVKRAFVERLSALEFSAPRLFWLRSDEVEKLRIATGSRSLVIERAENAFILKEPTPNPVALEVGNTRLEAITSIVGAPLLERRELPAPITHIELESRTQPDQPYFTESVRLGAANADGTSVVERESDGSFFTLSSAQAALLRPDATLIKPLKVLDLPRAQIARVNAEGPNFSQTFEQKGPGSYELLVPAGFSHDGATTDAVIGALSDLHAEHWVADTAEERHGLSGKLGWTFKVSLADGPASSPQAPLPKSVTLLVGARTERGFFANVDTIPGVFVLPSATYQTLTTWAFDRGICEIPADFAASVLLKQGNKTLTLRLDGNIWRAFDTAGREVSERVQALLEALSSLRAEAALHPGPAQPFEGLTRPWLTLEATPRQASAAPRRCGVGAGDSWNNMSVHYLRNAGTDATFVIARSKIQAIAALF